MIYFQFKQDLVLKMLCLMAVWHPPPPGTQGQWSPGPARTGIPCPKIKGRSLFISPGFLFG